jgi:polyisoprenoid-binding protein YceI
MLLVAASLASTAQVQYKLDSKNSSIVVKGTSTIHDWEMNVKAPTSAFTLQEDQSLEKLTSGSLTVDVASIESDKNIMNKKAWEALKEKKFPQIKAKLLQVSQNGNSGTAQLELTIAGKTQKITDDFKFTSANGTIKIEGVLNLKMTDFGVEPPTAMMGTIKTGDEIRVEYRLVYNK